MASTWMRTRKRGDVVRREDEVGLRFYMQYFLLWKVWHVCQRSSPDSFWCTPAHVVFIGAVCDVSQRAASPVWFLFWRSRNYSGYCQPHHCQDFALILGMIESNDSISALSFCTDMGCSAYLIICINMSHCCHNYAFYWYSPFDRVKSSLGFCFHCPFHGF